MTEIIHRYVPADESGNPILPISRPRDIEQPGTVLVSSDDYPELLGLAGLAPTRQDAIDRLKQVFAEKSSLMSHDPGDGTAVLVQTDKDSRTNITGAMLLAQLYPDSFTDNWTLADNSKLPVDSAGMIALATASGLHIKACHDRYDTLREAIQSADTDAAAWAIDITTGWPASCPPDPAPTD